MNYQQYNPVPPEMMREWTEYREREKIRKAAWAAALPGLFFFLATMTISFVISFIVVKSTGPVSEGISNFLSDPIANQVFEIVLSLVLMTLPFILTAKLSGYSISAHGGFNKPKKGTVLPHLLFGVGFCAFANIAVSAAGDLFKRYGVDYSVPRGEDAEGALGFVLTVISTAIVPALVEEFAFRGIVLGILRPWGDVFAIFASSAVFGILHGNFEQMPFAFLVGLALGFIRIKSDSIVVPMVVHGVNNLISVLLSQSDAILAVYRNIAYTVYILLILVAAVLGIMLLKHKGEFSFPKVEREITAGKTYRYFFFSPAIILFSVLLFARAILYFF